MPQTQSNHRSPRPSRTARRRAFTLIQVLVAIGIIVVLMAILVPTVITARKQAQRTRQKLDLETIGTGMEAFKADHGEYPSIDFIQSMGITATDGAFEGADILGYCLVGPGQQIQSNSTGPFTAGQFVTTGSGATANYWVCLRATTNAPNPTGTPPDVTADKPDDWWHLTLPYWDNQNGVGGRTLPWLAGADGVLGTADDMPQGKPFGPYLDASRFKMRGLQILDQWGNPILYFPANPAKPNVHRAGTLVDGTTTVAAGQVTAGYIENSGIGRGTPNPRRALYDANYGIDTYTHYEGGTWYRAFWHDPTMDNTKNAFIRFLVSMGDLNENGVIDAGDGTPVMKDYLLWSAGPDGYFGYNESAFNADPTKVVVRPTDLGKLQNFDDVTNFRE